MPANIFEAPLFSRGEIQCIGANGRRPEVPQSRSRRDRSPRAPLSGGSRFPPPNEDDAIIKILFGIKDRYEKFHAVSYTDESIEAGPLFTSSPLHPRPLPARQRRSI